MAIVPQRISLLAQTVDSLRNGIAREQWVDFLPPERVLCENLKISRSTLRRAIAKIEDEGLIDAGGPGRRRGILKKPSVSKESNGVVGAKTIVWLTLLPLSEMPSINLRLIALLHSRLAGHDCMLNVVRMPEKVMANPEEGMAPWLETFAADVCILHWMPEQVQRWFYLHRPTTCIMGTPAKGVDLASVEVDSYAAMQHAVAMLRRQGHRHLALVRQDQHMVGDDRIERSLLELCKDEIQASVLSCPQVPELMAHEFEGLFAQTDIALPTVLICTSPEMALFALTWLQKYQISVPAQVSIILLRSQPILRYTCPSLAHYVVNEERVVTQLLPRLLDLLQSKACATSHMNLIPEFVLGESLGEPRAQGKRL